MRKYYIFLTIIGLIILTLIVIGFITVTNPIKQRNKRVDQQLLNMMGDIASNVDDYYRTNYQLPDSLESLRLEEETRISLSNNVVEYKAISSKDFELCTTFDTEDFSNKDYSVNVKSMYYLAGSRNHKEGYDCLEFSINNL